MDTQPSKPAASIPVPSATTPFWRSQKHVLDAHRSTSTLPDEQDVVIIGAGFAGASCAYYISQQSPPPRTTILEAREACSGATARNGGHLRPDSLATFQNFTSTYGIEIASDIALFELENCKAVKDVIAAEKIQCDYAEVTSSSIFLDEEQGLEAKKLLDTLNQEGHDIMARYKYSEGQAAEDVSGVKGAKSVTTFPAASVWPYKLIMHLLSIATSKGINLQTNTPVTNISASPDPNGLWTLSTPRGEIKAKKVIFATNGYTSHLLSQYNNAIIPIRGICSHITSATERPPISKDIQTAAIRYSPGHHDYLMTRPDGSIIVGGAWRVIRPGPREDWVNVTDDSGLIPAATDYYTGFMDRTFKSWEGTKSDVDYLWTGIMGSCPDQVPHIGSVDEKPGLYVCAGFNGHGMPQVLLCAKGTVKMVLEGRGFEETGVPSVFQTTAERQAAAAAK